ncbi:MAG: hypothetical protein WCX97_02875 [Candidatus Magasanikbacteria bacterium]
MDAAVVALIFVISFIGAIIGLATGMADKDPEVKRRRLQGKE